MTLLAGFASRRQVRAAARQERRKERVRRRLEDALYNLEHWSFADRPSQYEDRQAGIHRLIRAYESLGGDALALVYSRDEYLLAQAMPETFVRTKEIGRNGWRTERVSKGAA